MMDENPGKCKDSGSGEINSRSSVSRGLILPNIYVFVPHGFKTPTYLSRENGKQHTVAGGNHLPNRTETNKEPKNEEIHTATCLYHPDFIDNGR